MKLELEELLLDWFGRWFDWVVAGVLVLVLLLGVAIGRASAHEGDLGAWYKSLRVPGTEMPCCDQSDCVQGQARQGAAGYEVLAPDGEWRPVPENVILRRANPTGFSVACWYGGRLLCFVPANEV